MLTSHIKVIIDFMKKSQMPILVQVKIIIDIPIHNNATVLTIFYQNYKLMDNHEGCMPLFQGHNLDLAFLYSP